MFFKIYNFFSFEEDNSVDNGGHTRCKLRTSPVKFLKFLETCMTELAHRAFNFITLSTDSILHYHFASTHTFISDSN